MKKILCLFVLCLSFSLVSCNTVMSPQREDQTLDTLPTYEPQAVDTPDQIEMKEADSQDANDEWQGD